MKTSCTVAGAILLAMFVGTASHASHAIPKDQLDKKKIYWGNGENFTKPGKVDFDELIKATPEYIEIKEKKIERGSGKYWLLMSQASDRVVKALSYVGEETEYDLIAGAGYLEGLDPAIEADDLTKSVIEAMEELAGD